MLRTERNQTFNAEGNLVAEEVVEVDITREVRTSQIEQRVQQVIGRLQTIEDLAASRNTIVGDANNLNQANVKFDQIENQLAAVANAVTDVCRILRYAVIYGVVPDLLEDDTAASDLDPA